MAVNSSWLICAGLFCSLLGLFTVQFAIKPGMCAAKNSLSIASKVRDADEVRLSHAISQIGDWTLQDRLPLGLRTFHKRRRHGRSDNLLILVLSSSRPGLDAFEPQYLTQTVTHILMEIQIASPTEYPQFGNVWTTVCVIDNEDTLRSSYTGELSRIKRVLGSYLISPKTLPGVCEPLTDLQSCLKVGLEADSLTTHIVVLEDDFLVTEHFLPTLRKYLKSMRGDSSVMQLYVDSEIIPSDVAVDRFIWLLLFISGLPVVVALIFVYIRFSRRREKIFLVVFLCLLSLIVVAYQLSGDAVHLMPSPSLQAPSSGAAIVLPRSAAISLVSQPVFPENCSTGEKGRFIGNFLQTSKYTVLAARPAAVIHIGMYSSSQRKMLNPLLFPH